MRVLSVLFLISPLLFLSFLGQPVHANSGFAVDDPSNLWAPYGPRSPLLLYRFYTNEVTEFNDFQIGQLDVTDWPQVAANYPTYDNNPDFVFSPAQGQFGMFGVDFNYAASTWASWGCDWQHGKSACGIEIREAFAHLIDRPRFVTDGPLQGGGQALADPSPPAKDPSASPVSTQCTWDTLSQSPCLNAFNIAPDSGGFAQQGSPDFCAAVNHVIQAVTYAPSLGLRRNPTNSCAIDATSPGLSNIINHPIRFMVRSDDSLRLALGQGLTLAINQLFGAGVVQPTYASIIVLRPIVFASAPVGDTDDWDMYTFGWTLTGPFPDHLHSLYDSASASNFCGGALNGQT